MSDAAGDLDEREAVVTSGAATIHVLHVDDEQGIRETTSLWLERVDDRLEVATAPDGDAALEYLDRETVDCVVSDYDMPGTTGLELLEAVRERQPGLPFILFTGKGSEEIASEAISAGVTDYLQKEVGSEQYALLANRIERAVSERRTESALAESERVLSTLMSNLPGMVYRCRNERGWPMTFVSDGALDVIGYDSDALVDGDVSYGADVIHPEDREAAWDGVQAAVAEGVPFKLEYRVRTKQGTTRWVREHGRAVGRTVDGDQLLEGVVTDVTEEHEREAQLRRTKQRYRRLVEQSLFGIYILRDGVVEYANQRMAEIFGYEPDEFEGIRALDAVAEADHDTLRENIRRVRAGEIEEIHDEYTGIRKDGTRFDFEFHSAVIEYEGEPALLGALQDISDRKERERELERYERMLDTVGDAVYALDENRRFIAVNETLTELTGYDRAELLGASADLVIPERDAKRALELRRELRETDTDVVTMDLTLQRKDGGTVPCEVRFRQLLGSDGEYRGTAGVARDVTDRRERQSQLERQNERLEQFAHLVSHDLRNPLNVAETRLELFERTGDAEHYEKVGEAHDRLDAIVEDVLELARRGRTVDDTEPVPIDRPATAAWDLAACADASLSLASTGTVSADQGRLQALFENLFANACTYGGETPTVTVGTFTAGDLAGSGGFFVADDGPGIPVDEREAVFEAGHSTAESGTGFGLNIVETIAEAHGWAVFAVDAADLTFAAAPDADGAAFVFTGVDVAPDAD
jgi:PAS domain S-box-containing protein